MTYTEKLSPLVGESVSGADERGKGEQKRKNRNKCEQKRKSKISMSKIKKYRNESYKKFVSRVLSQKQSIQNASCLRLSGKVSADRLTKGASVSRHEKRFLTK